jgi:N-acyl homoserine lactone hydrolase
MRIHALTTGMVRLKDAFLHARTDWRRRLDLLLPGEWCEPVPIHCWAIEHAGEVTLVDTGEVASVHDAPFARFEVTPQEELPAAFSSAGIALEAVNTVVLTHLHGDHMDGAVHVKQPVLVHDAELRFAHTVGSRVTMALLRQPLPSEVDFQPLALDHGPFGAFTQSRRLSDDGRIVAVGTPGHTPGHISVICVDDDGRHVLLAGDASDTQDQLRSLRADAVCPKPDVMIATMRTILAHAAEHPTVYLPSHDPFSVRRLRAGSTL